MSRDELLRSVRPGTQTNKDFFLKVYGYDIGTPGFAEKVLVRLGILGNGAAREYYHKTIGDYETQDAKIKKEVGEWYAKQLQKEREGAKKRNGERGEKYKFAGFPQDW